MLKLLITEDDLMIADTAEEILIEHGCEVCGTRSLPLSRLGVLYATSNISQVVLTTADGDACLSKPYRSVDLLRGLEIVAEIIATGRALLPFPKGFQVFSVATAPPGAAA